MEVTSMKVESEANVRIINNKCGNLENFSVIFLI
jgi:hypothetical protein